MGGFYTRACIICTVPSRNSDAPEAVRYRGRLGTTGVRAGVMIPKALSPVKERMRKSGAKFPAGEATHSPKPGQRSAY